MSYTALDKMRIANQVQYGPGAGPAVPAFPQSGAKAALGGVSLRDAVLRFLNERCEDLRFDAEKEASEKNGVLLGASLCPGQIPYNMQMDIDRLCLARELETFIGSGVAEDAYTVYYCYLEMFFGHYGKSKKMVELLSEFETNGSALLMKHRDHFSHSVYVFALGLAVYETNPAFRAAFQSFYGYQTPRAAAVGFLEYWGLTALFHDIGYPFELPFEQVMSYYEVDGSKRRGDSPFPVYRNMESVISLSPGEQAHFCALFGRSFDTTEALLAFGIASRLRESYGVTEEELLHKLHRKPTAPDEFGYYMDHAYFSATRLYRELVRSLGINAVSPMHIDALTAILLHNSLYKFVIAEYKTAHAKPPMTMQTHPLAFLLMLCDELQCWDRTAYGRNSRTELHPMDAAFDFGGNAICAIYYYDHAEQEKIDRFRMTYASWKRQPSSRNEPRLKAYSDMADGNNRFVSDIERIVDTSDIPLTVIASTRDVDYSHKHTYLSASSFLHLYDFAVSLNARYTHHGRDGEIAPEELERSFEELSLEYQLSNINQAKRFARYLDAIGCFYTDRPVDYEMVRTFTADQTSVFAPMEHERWVSEHIRMGWVPGDLYETAPLPDGMAQAFGSETAARKALREQLRMHKLAMRPGVSSAEIYAHYETLPEEEKGKDSEPFNRMLSLIRQFDGLRIYRLHEGSIRQN